MPWDRAKAIARLTAEAADGDQEAADVLRELQRPAAPPKSADGGAGGNPAPQKRDPAQAFNDMVRDAHRPERAFPPYLKWALENRP